MTKLKSPQALVPMQVSDRDKREVDGTAASGEIRDIDSSRARDCKYV